MLKYIEICINLFKNKLIVLIVFLPSLFLFNIVLAQTPNVVVSEYFNSNSNDEWIELLVINDNTDLRNCSIRDNGGSQNSWQGEATFANISLWNNLRAGTVIIIWLRSAATFTIDTLKSDGFIQVSAQLSNYLSGSAMTIGGAGDIIQLIDNLGNNIHALGHRPTVGSSFTGIIGSNKLNYNEEIITGDNVSICPGSSISDYIGGSSDSLKTSKGASYVTQGLPNKRGSDTVSNLAFWRILREPPFTGIALNTPIDSFAFGKVHLAWTTSGWTDQIQMIVPLALLF